MSHRNGKERNNRVYRVWTERTDPQVSTYHLTPRSRSVQGVRWNPLAQSSFAV